MLTAKISLENFDLLNTFTEKTLMICLNQPLKKFVEI